MSAHRAIEPAFRPRPAAWANPSLRSARRACEQTNSPRAPPRVRRGPNAANIMYDKRVVRGNTYAAQILPATAQAEQLEMERQAQRTHNTTKKIKTVGKPSTPEAVDGRKHIDVQTEQYLEELTDRPVEVDIDTQARTARAPPPVLAPSPPRHLADAPSRSLRRPTRSWTSCRRRSSSR